MGLKVAKSQIFFLSKVDLGEVEGVLKMKNNTLLSMQQGKDDTKISEEIKSNMNSKRLTISLIFAQSQNITQKGKRM